MDNHVELIPSEAVIFKSLTQPQSVELVIKNNWDQSIIFKMKTTRPQIFKMRPVFGKVDKNQEKTIRLIFKGFGQKEKPPCSRDRFTIVFAPAPINCLDPSRVWKLQSCPEVLTQTSRKVLRIEYGEVDESKITLAPPPQIVSKTPQELDELRKQYPNVSDGMLQQVPSPIQQKSAPTSTLSTNQANTPPPAAASKQPSNADLNNNKNDTKEDNTNNNKKPSKDTTEDSSSSSSGDGNNDKK